MDTGFSGEKRFITNKWTGEEKKLTHIHYGGESKMSYHGLSESPFNKQWRELEESIDWTDERVIKYFNEYLDTDFKELTEEVRSSSGLTLGLLEELSEL